MADVVAFGGQEKIYEVQPDPVLLVKYGITSQDVFSAVEKSNLNVGGDVVVTNEQAFVEGTDAKWWTMLTPKRKQEIALGAMVTGIFVAVITVLVAARKYRRYH